MTSRRRATATKEEQDHAQSSSADHHQLRPAQARPSTLSSLTETSSPTPRAGWALAKSATMCHFKLGTPCYRSTARPPA
eukprot:2799890-Pyramimonas_sp.AAC.1